MNLLFIRTEQKLQRIQIVSCEQSTVKGGGDRDSGAEDDKIPCKEGIMANADLNNA